MAPPVTAGYRWRAALATIALLVLNAACQEQRRPTDSAQSSVTTMPSTAPQSAMSVAVSPRQPTPVNQVTPIPNLAPQAQAILVDYPNTTAVIPPHGTLSFRRYTGSLGPPPTPDGGGALRIDSIADQPATLTYDFAGHLTLVTAPDQAIVILEGPTGVFSQRCVLQAHQLNSVQCAASLQELLTFDTVSSDHVFPVPATAEY